MTIWKRIKDFFYEDKCICQIGGKIDETNNDRENRGIGKEIEGVGSLQGDNRSEDSEGVCGIKQESDGDNVHSGVQETEGHRGTDSQ